ncbi:MAG TPA: hypothetical protein VEX68_28515, partial [Bryobacteraceae bacterium]|nr:hypothetical protein [Bryobacteraceae bacterium]
AAKESRKDADGNWQSRTDWHRVVASGKLTDTPDFDERVLRHGAGSSADPGIRACPHSAAAHGGPRDSIGKLESSTVRNVEPRVTGTRTHRE